MGKLKDLTGQRFGALTVLSREPDCERTSWRCKCDCGKEYVALSTNLLRGAVTSCGCGMYRHAKLRGGHHMPHIDITGQKYGELTAVRFISRDRWLWRCSCGKEVEIRASSVKSGKVVSCGHVLKDLWQTNYDKDRLGHVNGTSISLIKSIRNGKLRSTNTTGYTGVTVRYNMASVVYRARIIVQGKCIYLGQFGTLDEAVTARKDAERKYFAPLIADAEERKKTEEKQCNE